MLADSATQSGASVPQIQRRRIPSIVAFADDPRARLEIQRACGADPLILLTDSWPALLREAPTSDCLAVVTPWLRDEIQRTRIADLRTRHPHHALIVVTNKDADNVRHLRTIVVDELIWLHDLARDFVPATRRACAHTKRQMIANAIDSASSLAPRLREALRAAAMRTEPVRTLQQLAAVARCDRTTLWYHWHRDVDRALNLRPQDYVDWLLLLHAVAAKDPNRNWSAAADAAGVHQHTVARIARRLLGQTLRAVEQDGYAGVAEQFESRMLRPLCASGSTKCDEPRRFAVEERMAVSVTSPMRTMRHTGRTTHVHSFTEAEMLDETIVGLDGNVVELDESSLEVVGGSSILIEIALDILNGYRDVLRGINDGAHGAPFHP